VAPLHRAVAFADVDAAAVAVHHDLHLDVAVLLEPLSRYSESSPERGTRLGAAHRDGLLELARRAHHPHAAPATARGRLDEHRIADVVGLLQRVGVAVEHPSEPGIVGRPCARAAGACPAFEANRSSTSGGGPDERQAVRARHLGERVVLGQEP
jgi:hypothetical protein